VIRLTVHVRRRIVERHLALPWIEAAASAPDWAEGPIPIRR